MNKPAKNKTPAMDNPFEHLTQGHEEFRAVFHQSAVGMVQMCIETGRFIRVNAKYCELTGYTSEELETMMAADLEFPLDRGIDANSNAALLNGEVPFYEVEKRYIRKDGAIIWAHINTTLIKNSNGRPERTMAVVQDITERQHATKEYQRLSELLDTLLHTAPIGICLLDRDLCYEHINARLAEMNGLPVEMHLGRHISEIVPNLVDHIKTVTDRILTTGEAILNHEFCGETEAAPGVLRYWNHSWYTVRDSAGKISGFGAIIEETTERKHAENALRESQGFTRRVLDNLFTFVGVMDVDGTLTEVNTPPLEAAGIASEEVIGKKFWDCYWWSYSEEIQSRLRDACERAAMGETTRYDVPVRMNGGSVMWIDFQIGPLRDHEGNITHIIPSGTDITARRAAVEKLRHSEQRFRALADNIPQLAWMCDAEGHIFWYNQRWFDYTGTTLEEMEGWGWEKVHHPDHLPLMLPTWKSSLERGEPWEDKFPLRSKDGEYRWFLSRAFPIFDDEGQIIRWFGTNTDIHDERRAMEELARASRAKDDFLAALSHELRTPLSPVLMTATALASDPSLPAAARAQLAMMRRNIELEARLIDDLLDLTGITNGKLVIAPVITDIHELLHHTEEIMRSDSWGKRLNIVLKLDATYHHALVDPTRIQQVFWNLLRNAVKFTPVGGSITLSTRNDANNHVVISIADNGIGIRAEALEQIFNAFEQGDTTGEHRYGGLGLGLAISNAVIAAHKGQIRAESEGLGLGANFTVTLSSAPAPIPTSDDLQTHSTPARSLALLVVEDHDASRVVLAKLLTLNGHRVITAATVHEALGAYKSAHFDVVLSDLGLPDGSGIDLMAQIQDIRPVKAIALSGYGMENDRQKTKDAGFSAHLVKPIKVDQLNQLLAQLTA
jgi:PAS domain S-box-containing protein